jgi:uncharacterized protein YunC (DUF1805 family)
VAADGQQLARGLVMCGIVDMDEAHELALDAAHRLAKQAYTFNEE